MLRITVATTATATLPTTFPSFTHRLLMESVEMSHLTKSLRHIFCRFPPPWILSTCPQPMGTANFLHRLRL